MDIINLLPSPPQVFRLALSLFNSIVIANHRRIVEEHYSPIDFDVDATSGFLPRQPLPRLSNTFEIWEMALTDAMETLSLGEDESESALEKRHGGEIWRTNVKSVSV
jgi:indoleamine 2,3-dioxygenase